MQKILAATLGLFFAACTQSSSIPENAPKALGAIAERSAPPTAEQIADFGKLAEYVGMTWSGSPTAESEEQFTDIQKWEWALGGKAILIRHALEDGSYGGDTYVYRDSKTDELVYVYITNAGFHTVGTMTPTETGWVAEEDVNGHPDITKVRSTSVVHDDKSTTMTSEYLKSGEWVPGHAFEYKETSAASPALKSE